MDTKNKNTPIQPTEELVQKVIDAGEDWCAPTHVSHIAEYSLRITWAKENRNGVVWTGILYKGERPILTVDNDGNGGCNSYHQIPGAQYASRTEWHALRQAFVDDCAKAYPSERYEVEDTAVSFLDLISNGLVG